MKKVLLILGAVIMIGLCICCLNAVDEYEREKATEEGRTEVHYTSEGEVYYK